VETGALVLSLVDVELRNARDIAKRKRDVAQARYLKTVQTATAIQKELEEVAIAKAELDVAKAELAYAEDRLARARVVAERPGLLVYAAKSDWLGRPVKTGERILEIGDPSKTELRIELPVSDALSLKEGGRVALFLDGDPLQAIQATITRTSYRPVLNGESQLVYRVYAAFSDGTLRRIGLRGIARVSTEDVALGFYLFRRPVAALRQRLGL
jgi:hypothetical protein